MNSIKIDYPFIKQYFWYYKKFNTISKLFKNKQLPIVYNNGNYYVCYSKIIAPEIILLNITFPKLETFDNIDSNDDKYYCAIFFEEDKHILNKLATIYKIIYIDIISSSLQWIVRDEETYKLPLFTIRSLIENITTLPSELDEKKENTIKNNCSVKSFDSFELIFTEIDGVQIEKNCKPFGSEEFVFLDHNDADL